MTVGGNQKSADPTSATSGVAALCNTSTSLTLVGGGGGDAETIAWYTGSAGGTSVGIGNGLLVSPLVTTTYYGRYEDASPCSYNSASQSVTITVDCSLPVIINAISATSSKSDAIVAWSTATELNVSRFVIERSIDGSSFSDIGTVNAVGIGANNYQFTDNAPVNGVNYYRLKSIDNNGSFTYSKVVSVSLLTNNQLSVFPNPTTDKITVNGNHIASVQVVDNMGRITIAQTYKDVTNPVLSVSGLPVGVYHLRVQTTDGKISGIGFVKH